MKVAVQALGCKTNQYEMDALAESLRQAGFSLVDAEEWAHVYVLNSCTVTAEAERKARQLLRRYRRINPQALLVACGCYSQRGGLADLADLLIGTGFRDSLPRLIQERLAQGPAQTQILLQPASSWRHYEELGATAIPGETRAFLKIQDGCNNRCAYCAICLARGPSRSRGLEEILDEARQLADQGFKEIVLTGTNLNHFGRQAGSKADLAGLLEALDKVQGLVRIRLGSLESGTISPDFLDRIAGLRHLCPSFHLSLQSGSDRILKAMGRRDNQATYRRAVDGLRSIFPGAGITTDLIVGFPGETDRDFQETLSFCDTIAFTGLHVFRFSPRPGTAAAAMPDQVPRDLAIQRSEILRQKAQDLTSQAIKARLGQVRELLIEQHDSQGRAEGYTPEYLHVKALEADKPSQRSQRGQIRQVRLLGQEGLSALGQLL